MERHTWRRRHLHRDREADTWKKDGKIDRERERFIYREKKVKLR